MENSLCAFIYFIIHYSQKFEIDDLYRRMFESNNF